MNGIDVLADAFGRVRETVHDVVDGLNAQQLSFRVDQDANSIAWLVWHLTRVQDDHIAGVAGTEQLWTAQGWAERFDLPFPPAAIGYGHDTDEVAAIRVDSPEPLIEYYDVVHDHTLDYLQSLSETDLDRVVDTSWTPHVTLGVRLVSVVNDDLQHAGQAAFVRGIVLRRGT